MENPYPDFFPEVKKVFLFSNCPHRIQSFEHLAHVVGDDSIICFKNKLVMQVLDVWWHEYGHVIAGCNEAHGRKWAKVLEGFGKGYLAKGWDGVDPKLIPILKSDPAALSSFLLQGQQEFYKSLKQQVRSEVKK